MKIESGELDPVSSILFADLSGLDPSDLSGLQGGFEKMSIKWPTMT